MPSWRAQSVRFTGRRYHQIIRSYSIDHYLLSRWQPPAAGEAVPDARPAAAGVASGPSDSPEPPPARIRHLADLAVGDEPDLAVVGPDPGPQEVDVLHHAPGVVDGDGVAHRELVFAQDHDSGQQVLHQTLSSEPERCPDDRSCG